MASLLTANPLGWGHMLPKHLLCVGRFPGIISCCAHKEPEEEELLASFHTPGTGGSGMKPLAPQCVPKAGFEPCLPETEPGSCPPSKPFESSRSEQLRRFSPDAKSRGLFADDAGVRLPVFKTRLLSALAV